MKRYKEFIKESTGDKLSIIMSQDESESRKEAVEEFKDQFLRLKEVFNCEIEIFRLWEISSLYAELGLEPPLHIVNKNIGIPKRRNKVNGIGVNVIIPKDMKEKIVDIRKELENVKRRIELIYSSVVDIIDHNIFQVGLRIHPKTNESFENFKYKYIGEEVTHPPYEISEEEIRNQFLRLEEVLGNTIWIYWRESGSCLIVIENVPYSKKAATIRGYGRECKKKDIKKYSEKTIEEIDLIKRRMEIEYPSLSIHVGRATLCEFISVWIYKKGNEKAEDDSKIYTTSQM